MTATANASRRTTPMRGDPGAILAGASAVLLFISLFVNWYQPGLSAWTVFEVWDLVLAGIAIWTLAVAAGRLGVIERRPDSWLVIPAAAAFVVVVAALVNHPPAAIGHSPTTGAWLALAASILMLAGSALSVAHVTVAVEFEDDGSAPPRRRRYGRSERTETTSVFTSDPDGPPAGR